MIDGDPPSSDDDIYMRDTQEDPYGPKEAADNFFKRLVMPDIATPGGMEKWKTWLKTEAGYSLSPQGATTDGSPFARSSSSLPATYKTGRPTPNVACAITPHRANRTPYSCPGREDTERHIRDDQAHLDNHNPEKEEALATSARETAVKAATNDGRPADPHDR